MANKVDRNDYSVYHMIDDRAFEPQRTNHSYVQFDLTGITGLNGEPIGALVPSDKSNYNGTTLLRLALTSHGMPNHSGEVLNIRKGNEVLKFNGGETYSDISISVTDWIGADIEYLIASWDALRYNPKTGMSYPAYHYKKTGHIIQYSPDGEIVRSWELKGAWINNVEYGEYDRSSTGDAREISFTIHVDIAYPEARTANASSTATA